MLNCVPIFLALYLIQGPLSILVYLAFALVPFVAFLLYRTQLGLPLRGAGELPAALSAVPMVASEGVNTVPFGTLF